MIEQLDLDGNITVVGLTARQQHALEALERMGGGSIDEVGAAVHEFSGRHRESSRCRFCSDSGSEVLYALRSKGLVARRSEGMWVSTRALESAASAGLGPGRAAVSNGPGLPASSPPRARSTDPVTSVAAAASVTDLTGKQQAVLSVFARHGSMHDEGLLDAYDVVPDLPAQTDSGLRTRRHELVEAGLVADSGRKATTAAGRATVVWEITDAGMRCLASSGQWVPF